MNWTRVVCHLCKKRFQRPAGQFNEAIKFGWKQFCSWECLRESKLTGKKLTCSNKECGEMFYRSLKEIKKVQQSFCSTKCSAIVNNKLRVRARPKKHCVYQGCKSVIPRDQKYCSLFHSSLARRISIDVFRNRFKEKIESFYQKHGRIPVKREMYGSYREAREFFGSWNNAIKIAGFTPNPVLFSKKQRAYDGHQCDSLAEKMIDDWLDEKDITHERNIKYPSNPRLTADFVTKHHWIEFFGLAGEIKEYDALIREKQRIARRYKLPLVELYPKDLFPVSRLPEKLLK